MSKLRVGIVEDDDEIRNALALLVRGTTGLECVGVYPNCEVALAEVTASPPDVLLLDIGLPGISGLDALPRFRAAAPQTDIVMLTIRDDDEAVFLALERGASGYLLKTTAPARIVEAVTEARNGGAPMSPSIARRVAESFRRSTATPLSPRENEILLLLCEGHSYKTIAAQLYLSVETVHSHLKSIYRKLEVDSKSGAVAKALRQRIV